MKHEGHEPSRGRDHSDHHAHMLADFKKRFIVSFILTFPVLLLSPTIQSFFGFELRFPGADFFTFLLSSVVYFYGGYPFLKGIKEELAEKSPGNDDSDSSCYQCSLFLQLCCGFRASRRSVFLGTGDPHRCNAVSGTGWRCVR